MSHSPHVVDGEASESDTEIGKTPDSNIPMNPDTFVISGEASESDDEESRRPCPESPTNLDVPLNPAMSQPNTHSRIYTSLLHQKLWECNVSLRASIQGLFKHTTDISVEKLSRADKGLLNVQESMRATNANLTLAKARLKQLEAVLEEANCGSALPTVKIRT